MHNCPPPASSGSLCSSVVSGGAAEVTTIVADPPYNIWQGQVSPDGRCRQQQLGVGPRRLVVLLTEATGGVWTLDNVAR